MSLTVDADEGIGNTLSDTAPWTSSKIPATPNIDEGSLRSGKEMEVDLQQSMSLGRTSDYSDYQDNNETTRKQLVQTLTLDDLNPHGLYPQHHHPLSPQPINVLYDSGASITMLPGAFAE